MKLTSVFMANTVYRYVFYLTVTLVIIQYWQFLYYIANIYRTINSVTILSEQQGQELYTPSKLLFLSPIQTFKDVIFIA